MKLGQWIGLIALLISLYILWQIRQVLLLIFTAVIFATALNGIVVRWRRSGVGRGFGAILSILVLLTILGFFAVIIVPPFISQFNQLAQLVPVGVGQLSDRLDILRQRLPGSPVLPDLDMLVRQAQPFAQWAVNNFFSLFSNILTIVLSILLVFVLTIMLLINPKPYRQGFISLFPAFYRRRTDEILTKCQVSLTGWTRGILIDMVVVGIVSAIGLSILRVPLVFANASIAGLLEAIPNVGPTLSLIPPVAVALLDAPWKAVAVIILYLLIQQLEQYLLVPFVMQQQVSLLPAVTLIAQVVFAIFFGFLGLFLAIPLVIVAQIWIQEILVKDLLNQWGEDSRVGDRVPVASSDRR
ncbi:AI-2E family transporter [Leptolyngbya ohadii]|uniref:AI-2E family transporter n=1 Tax=Leptolyngbya ohadii TaxID=1962290 RepID=UPI000B5A0467|nr:AI-2E family transporter [Leptolyngbya ohadii]